jgi:hypothetical protein
MANKLIRTESQWTPKEIEEFKRETAIRHLKVLVTRELIFSIMESPIAKARLAGPDK